MSWNTRETTKTLWLDGHQKEDGSVSLVNDFEAWKLKLDHLPTAKEAWDEQQVTINDLHSKVVIAGDTLKRSRAVINELKAFTEENLKIMHTLEQENNELKERLGESNAN
jgi:hypothetical protein